MGVRNNEVGKIRVTMKANIYAYKRILNRRPFKAPFTLVS